MNRTELTDREWEVIHRYLKSHPRVYVGEPSACRRFVNAVLWIVRSGSPWRLLPRDKGHWNHVFKRFARWSRQGVWSDLFAQVRQEADLEQVLLDSTVVRAHPCAAGAKKVRPKRKAWADPGAGSVPRFMS